uniref:BPTI/Kunitz inhibitor domain-containing protein n=1 Tax=Rhabditophanes sp. KR3021 TaxID=114890 RepID=A0AC35TN49_9BILA
MKVCQPFFGCQSNGNSFKTVLECRQKCQDVKRAEANVSRYELSQLCNATYTPNLKIDIEKCDKEKMCKNNYVCLNSTCCPKKEYVCSLQFDSGKEVEENKHEGRYAYNQAAKQCFRFSYFRSQGNFNNFRTCKDAVDYCKTN